MRTDVAHQLLPRIKDTGWFFDTELMIKAYHRGLVIHEHPVTWVEDTDSRVNIISTAREDIRGLLRVRAELDKRSLREKLTLPILLAGAFGLYLFGAMHNDMANSYYSAAVQAASTSWKAWFFGSLDAANYITVDKPPVATMLMGLSARIFGFSTFSMLLPSVLAGVGSIWLVFAAVRRQFGFASAAIAGSVLALTPVAALMFGFNNPDAILTLLLTASGYAFLRSLEQQRPLLWLGLAGLFSGLAFNTKMLQGLMVLPAMGLTYLVFAKPPLVQRTLHMAWLGISSTIATFWWSAIVWLTPAASRPYIGSTSDNSIWSLIFGYNGFGRLLGNMNGGGPGGIPGGGQLSPGAFMGGGMPPTGTVPGVDSTSFLPPEGMPGIGAGGPGGSGFGGQTSLTRMFNADFGPNIGWLLLAALIAAVVMLIILRRTPRDNRGRAAVAFWGIWLVTHIVIFSMTSGIIHPYYVVAMAPAIAALIGIGAPFLWSAYVRRNAYAWLLPITVLATTATSVTLLSQAGQWPALGWTIALAGLLGGGGLLVHLYGNVRAYVVPLAAGLSTIAMAAGPVLYTLSTVTRAHTGSIPTSGPTASAMSMTNNESSTAESTLIEYLLEHQGGATWLVAVSSANESAPLQLSSGQPVMALGGFSGSDNALSTSQLASLVTSGQLKYYAVGGRGGGPGGMRSSTLTDWLSEHGTVVNYGGSSMTLYELSI